MAELAKAYVQIIPSMQGVSSAIKKSLSGVDTGSIGKNYGKNLGSGISSGLSTMKVAIGSVIGNVISSGLSAITSSIDDAISRVDTLNQFPKVMQNIGFSTEDAEEAINKLSDGIEGLPTALDEIVGNAQQLALSMGDLDSATDVALALNDGFITFGASTYDVTNAITQLNQMITAGKYDMQSWNSINQAAPGFLDTVADSMLGAEASASDLREALNEGTITSDDFLNAIVKLDQEGSDSVTAFSQSAQDASGGIETSMTNCKTAITKNLANIIDTINGDGGAITGFFDNLKQTINEAGSWISGNLVPVFQDAFKKLSENQGIQTFFSGLVEFAKGFVDVLVNDVIPTVTDFIDAFMESEAVQFVLGAIQTAIEAVGGVIQDYILPFFQSLAGNEEAMNGIATAITAIVAGLVAWKVAQAAYNAVQAITNGLVTAFSSIGIVGLIVTIVTAIITLWNTSEGFRDTVINIFNTISTVVSTVMNAIWTVIQTIWNAIYTVISTIVTTIWTVIQTIWNAIYTTISTILTAIWTVISTVWNTISTVVTTVVNAIWNTISTIWNAICTTVTTVLNTISSVVQSVWNGIWSFISTIINTIYNGISTVFNGLVSVMSTVWNTIKNTIVSAWNAIWNGIRSVVNTILSGIESFVNGVISGINFLLSGINAVASLFGIDAGLQISYVSLPRLASGGILEEGEIGLLEGSGAEAVVPLDQNRKWISKVAADMDASVGGEGVESRLDTVISMFKSLLSDGGMKVYTQMNIDGKKFAYAIAGDMTSAQASITKLSNYRQGIKG